MIIKYVYTIGLFFLLLSSSGLCSPMFDVQYSCPSEGHYEFTIGSDINSNTSIDRIFLYLPFNYSNNEQWIVSAPRRSDTGEYLLWQTNSGVIESNSDYFSFAEWIAPDESNLQGDDLRLLVFSLQVQPNIRVSGRGLALAEIYCSDGNLAINEIGSIGEPVPEPSSLLALAGGIGALGIGLRRRK